MKTGILFFMVVVGFAPESFGKESAPPSPGFAMAKRVAAHENGKDLPSRAVWLSQRVIKNSKSLAYQDKKNPETKKLPPPVVQN